MKRPYIFLLHLAYWLLYLLLLLVIISAVSLQTGQKPSFFSVLFYTPLGLLCFFPNLISFYTFYALLFPRFLSRRRIPSLIIYGALTCLASALLGGLALFIRFGAAKPFFQDFDQLSGPLLWLSLVAAIHGGIALVIKGFITWYDEIKLKEELAAKNYEMELALIKSQINPHFLFNTINNIDVLIARDAARASEYLNKLSDLLRYLVYETKTGKIALAEELSYIEKYLALQKIRTTNENYICFEVAGDPANTELAPMLFFPFIENAFKHTENNKRTNTIVIVIRCEPEKVIFNCENTYQKTTESRRDFGGAGNELIQKRLMLLYPGRHTLEIENTGGIYKVKLSIQQATPS